MPSSPSMAAAIAPTLLVYATGFRVNDMVSSLKLLGRNGIELPDGGDNRRPPPISV